MSDQVTITERLLTIISTLRRNINGVGNLNRVDTALLLAITNRLGRLMARCQILARRPIPTQPTKMPPVAAQPKPEAHPKSKVHPKPKAQLGAKIPGGKFWLLVLLPGQPIRESRAQFDDLIQRPEMIALVAQTPQLARQILRPLCRFFSLPFPAYLQLPPRPRKPRPYRARKPKPKPIKPPKPPEPTFLDYLLAKYPPIDEPAPQFFNPNQIRKLFSR